MRFVRPFQAAWRFFRRPKVQDITLVIVLAVPLAIALRFAIVQSSATRADVVYLSLFLAGTLPLLVRRSRPVAVAAVEFTLDALSLVTGMASVTSPLSSIAFYSVGRHTHGRTTAITAGLAAVGYSVLFEVTNPNHGSWAAGLVNPVLTMGLGQFLRIRAELNERRQRELADSAVRAERRRIARELHDVVAHHLSVINALVGGARATLQPEQDVTRDALSSAEQTARQALAEMRQLLDVLRADDGSAAGAATGVGAARLPSLVQEAETAGLPASLTVTGDAVPLPTAVDHAVYRIVQEALTNTRKHALSARASVRLAYEPEAVEVEVLDDGVAKPAGAPGFGLGGMAERVALCGGRLWTGPRPEGGFRVLARIPLEKA
ncbi:histidine kinase [Nonomuraea sp. NPDC005983]|uniref:sensor histidine kinase n=1 Tax=Nonomuraea sp. NPDC005983 TaxID=3155595 RepID=UPI0033AF9359